MDPPAVVLLRGEQAGASRRVDDVVEGDDPVMATALVLGD
jgi:hypothetical protein